MIGLSSGLDTDSIGKLIIKQNSDLCSSAFDCKVIKMWPTKKNLEVIQAILQLNIADYTRVINNGYLLIGLNLYMYLNM